MQIDAEFTTREVYYNCGPQFSQLEMYSNTSCLRGITNTIPLGTCRGLRLQAMPDNTGSQKYSLINLNY